MSPVEATLTDKQKGNLEKARRVLGLRSRADVIRWFAENAVEIVNVFVKPDELKGVGYIDQSEAE